MKMKKRYKGYFKNRSTILNDGSYYLVNRQKFRLKLWNRIISKYGY